MQLDDLHFADDQALLSQSQQQIQVETTIVAAASTELGLNIHKGKSKIFRYNTECTNPITLDGKDLDDVKPLHIWAASLMNLVDLMQMCWCGSASKNSIFTTEEHVEPKITVNQHQGKDFQYKCQDSSTV
ncbi:unnamed protein product [Schistosoma margrebowiei]|uniref:Uncharacterized protein n=1 Tax=Schistosoma margrebowiei TaxID=48269 RepID=A0A183LQP6_9TREM|nr:unnamed protein product [Schistosoma margrebowiei]